MNDPGAVAAVLTGLYERDGSLTAAAVVEASRAVTAPLHSRFEWDDDAAGEAYREVQAARLIRSVKVTLAQADPTSPPLRVRAFVNVPGVRALDDDPDDPGMAAGYLPQELVGADPVLSALALREMERRWRSLAAVYGQTKEFWERVLRDAPAA